MVEREPRSTGASPGQGRQTKSTNSRCATCASCVPCCPRARRFLSSTTIRMASAQIQALLTPPNLTDAHQRTKDYLNVRFQTFQDVQDSPEFDELVSDASKRNDELKGKVRYRTAADQQLLDTTVVAQLAQSQTKVDQLIISTRSATQDRLHTAQELSLLRHSLADELSFLSQELVSSLSGPDGKPTLLEDIETLHRNLKELESVKGYIQVVEYALKIGCVSAFFVQRSSNPWLVRMPSRRRNYPRHSTASHYTSNCRSSLRRCPKLGSKSKMQRVSRSSILLAFSRISGIAPGTTSRMRLHRQYMREMR